MRASVALESEPGLIRVSHPPFPPSPNSFPPSRALLNLLPRLRVSVSATLEPEREGHQRRFLAVPRPNSRLAPLPRAEVVVVCTACCFARPARLPTMECFRACESRVECVQLSSRASRWEAGLVGRGGARRYRQNGSRPAEHGVWCSWAGSRQDWRRVVGDSDTRNRGVRSGLGCGPSNVCPISWEVLACGCRKPHPPSVRRSGLSFLPILPLHPLTLIPPSFDVSQRSELRLVIGC